MIRYFDILFSLIGIIIFSPLFLFLSIVINLESRGGCIYKQIRVGKNGKDFLLYKFRSMRKDSDKKSLITIGGRDLRVTKVGYFIRKYKLDELPQLFNVLKGDMSLVGPRPEVRKYVEMYTLDQQIVLSIRPGITDYASIEYSNENEILELSEDPEYTYIHEIMPQKIALNMKYINSYNLLEYFKLIIFTLIKVFK